MNANLPRVVNWSGWFRSGQHGLSRGALVLTPPIELASDPLASFSGSPASGLLRRPAPTAGKDPLAGEAPWTLCAFCVSAVNP